MTREESKKYIRSMLTGHHPTATRNHYKDVATAIDVIYDSLQSESKELYFKRMTYLLIDGWEISGDFLFNEDGTGYDLSIPENLEEIADKLIAERENNGN